jgi:hypothetical protein
MTTTKFSATVGVTIALALSGVGIVLASQPGGSEIAGAGGLNAAQQQAPAISERNEPCDLGREVTAAALRKLADFPVYLPSTEIADHANLKEIWWCDTLPGVLAVYDNDVRVLVQSAELLKDPVAYWNTRIEESGVGSLGALNDGTPAFTIAPGGEYDEFGNVQVTIGTSWVSVIGNRALSLDELLQAAESLGDAQQ